MSIWAMIALGFIVLLIGFIILQRRKPSVADKVASGADSLLKTAEADAAAQAAKVEQAVKDKFAKK